MIEMSWKILQDAMVPMDIVVIKNFLGREMNSKLKIAILIIIILIVIIAALSGMLRAERERARVAPSIRETAKELGVSERSNDRAGFPIGNRQRSEGANT